MNKKRPQAKIKWIRIYFLILINHINLIGKKQIQTKSIILKKFEFRGLNLPINHSIENNNKDCKYNTDEKENKKSIFKNDEKYQHHFLKNK